MLIAITRIICNEILLIAGFFTIRKLINEPTLKFSLNKIIIILIGACLVSFITIEKYQIITPILSYLIFLIIYKFIFSFSITEAVVDTGIFMILVFLAELILSPIVFITLPNVEVARSVPWIMILSNISISLLAYLISKIKIVNNMCSKLVSKIDKIKWKETITFIILTIIILSVIFSIIANIYKFTPESFICLLTVMIFIILFSLYSRETNEYIILTDQYDELLKYVSEFEQLADSIEVERHEYKNDLAILQTKVKDKEIKEFINQKLTQKMEVDTSWQKSLKELPEGGIKGLLYYKIILAKNKKIEIKVDISKQSKKYLKRIDEPDYKILCRLFGIYLDNAIDATMNSKEKSMAIEIYELKNKLNIVISNSFTGTIDLSKVNKKGYTTKGAGHGKGLYYADRIIKENPIFKAENSIINHFYILRLVIDPTKKSL